MSLRERWDTWYLRYTDNWHKHPVISKVMCWMGRHDYEVLHAKVIPGMDNIGFVDVLLECFYCESKMNNLHRKVIAYEKETNT